MNAAAQPVLFGKLPGRGDFLRVGHADEALRFVETWLTTSVEQSRGELAAEPVRFLFAHADEALLGCWVPSRDEIGRQFPFACFERVPRDAAELGWSLLLGLHESFLGAAEALLRSTCAAPVPGTLEPRAAQGHSGPGPLDGLQAELAELLRPHPSELVRAAFDVQARLAAESVASFEQRAFGAPDTMPYALLTLREVARRGALDVTLDLPAASAFDLVVWLELAGCFTGEAPRFPSLTWCPQQARALVSAGPPASSTMAFLVDRRHPSSGRWPVWTERAAGAQAIRELTPAVQDVLAAGGSLAALAASLRKG
jgi:type VI secretion system ImpM family protein